MLSWQPRVSLGYVARHAVSGTAFIVYLNPAHVHGCPVRLARRRLCITSKTCTCLRMLTQLCCCWWWEGAT